MFPEKAEGKKIRKRKIKEFHVQETANSRLSGGQRCEGEW